MANRIQLRRDHSTNWTRVNPILSDGEPGLEIDTNKVKYGDGTTAWRDLSYAITGFRYANIQEGDIGHLVTSITGIPDDGISITSDNFAQLMWVPDTNTVTLANIYGNNGGPANFSWAYVDDTGFNVENKQPGTNFNWQFNFNGTTEFPNYSFPASDGSANQVLKTDGNGTLSWTTISGGSGPDFFNLGNANLTLHPTQIQIGNNLNGYETEEGSGIFRIDATGGGASTGNTTFNGDGIGNSNNGTVDNMTISPNWDGEFTGNVYLTLPCNANASNPVQLVNNSTGGVQIITQNNETWAFGADGVLTLSTASTILGNNLDPNVYIETVNGGTTNTWTFDTDGTLTLPLDNKINSVSIPQVGEILITGVEAYTSYVFGNTYSWHYADDPVFTTALNNGFLLPGNKVFPVGHLEQAVAIVGVGGGDDLQVAFDGPLGAGPFTVVSADYVPEQWAPVTIESNTSNWTFGATGTLTLPLNNKITSVNIAQVGQIQTGVEAYTTDLGSHTYSWHTADCPVFSSVLNTLITGGCKFYPSGHPEQAVTNIASGGTLEDLIISFDGPLGAGPFTVVSADYVAEQWAPVTIESNTATWVFDSSGTLTLPNGTYIDAGVDGQGIGLTTDRGTIRFGNRPELIGGPTHYHIMRDPSADIDLYFGDDYNYLLQPTGGGITIGSNIRSGTSTQYTWTFGTDGSLTFPDGGTLRIRANPPNTSKGVTGDKAGMIAFSTGFIYHCYSDYTDGSGDIWGRVSIDNSSF